MRKLPERIMGRFKSIFCRSLDISHIFQIPFLQILHLYTVQFSSVKGILKPFFRISSHKRRSILVAAVPRNNILLIIILESNDNNMYLMWVLRHDVGGERETTSSLEWLYIYYVFVLYYYVLFLQIQLHNILLLFTVKPNVTICSLQPLVCLCPSPCQYLDLD